MKKIVGLLICMLLIGTVLSVSGNVMVEKSSIPASTLNIQEPVLEADIRPQLGPFLISIRVTNIGNQTAHNVTISDTSFEGNVIYNHRDELVDNEILPGEYDYGSIGIFLGFNKFTLTVTVTCEGCFGYYFC